MPSQWEKDGAGGTARKTATQNPARYTIDRAPWLLYRLCHPAPRSVRVRTAKEWCIAGLFATHLHLSERGTDQVVAGAHRVLHLVERQVLVPHLVPDGDGDLPPRPITSATARGIAPEIPLGEMTGQQGAPLRQVDAPMHQDCDAGRPAG